MPTEQHGVPVPRRHVYRMEGKTFWPTLPKVPLSAFPINERRDALSKKYLPSAPTLMKLCQLTLQTSLAGNSGATGRPGWSVAVAKGTQHEYERQSVDHAAVQRVLPIRVTLSQIE